MNIVIFGSDRYRRGEAGHVELEVANLLRDLTSILSHRANSICE